MLYISIKVALLLRKSFKEALHSELRVLFNEPNAKLQVLRDDLRLETIENRIYFYTLRISILKYMRIIFLRDSVNSY